MARGGGERHHHRLRRDQGPLRPLTKVDADRAVEKYFGGGGGTRPARPDAPHGVRTCNPGNLRDGAVDWLGQTGVDAAGFCVFESSFYGIRALAKLLLTYHDKYGLCTVRGLISRWAPPNENDTEAYIRAVCADTAFDADAWLHLGESSVLAALVRAIVRHENGTVPYDDAEIAAGVEAALA